MPLPTLGTYVADGEKTAQSRAAKSFTPPVVSLSFLPSVVPITTVGRKQYIHPDEDYKVKVDTKKGGLGKIECSIERPQTPPQM